MSIFCFFSSTSTSVRRPEDSPLSPSESYRQLLAHHLACSQYLQCVAAGQSADQSRLRVRQLWLTWPDAQRFPESFASRSWSQRTLGRYKERLAERTGVSPCPIDPPWQATATLPRHLPQNRLVSSTLIDLHLLLSSRSVSTFNASPDSTDQTGAKRQVL